MSDLPDNATPRPVSLCTVLSIFVTFAAFLLVVYYVYLPKRTGSFSDDGIHTTQQRLDNLKTLQEKQNAQATKYGWVDQKAGVIQLPIERAMDLTVKQYGPKK